ncbi:hypothetical protein BN3659_02133 [Alistipes sp. CHKCI003]|nr:hypothetical protein BN3659_02133 [Alistipes sp. CHKCI003]
MQNRNAESECGIETRNRNAESERGIGTRNRNTESKRRIGTRNRNAESERGIGTRKQMQNQMRNQNAESKRGIETRNRNAESDAAISYESPWVNADGPPPPRGKGLPHQSSPPDTPPRQPSDRPVRGMSSAADVRRNARSGTGPPLPARTIRAAAHSRTQWTLLAGGSSCVR